MQPFEFYDRELLENLPDDIDEALLALSTPYIHFVKNENFYDEESRQKSANVSAVMHALFKSRNVATVIPSIDGNGPEGNKFIAFMNAIHANSKSKVEQRTHERNKQDYLKIFTKEPAYVFPDEDYNHLQKLMNELRELIAGSELIPPDHKRRLLNRLEAMQRELHKKTSDIDRFWGFIGEAGIVARKFGEDLKPITDRVETLGRIVIGVIMAKEGIKALPDIVKLLK